MGPALCRLTVGGVNYGVDTTNRLLKVSHTEEAWSQTAEVLIENADGNLKGLSLQGQSATLNYGYHTTTGDEYSVCAPLRVKTQNLISSPGLLVCQLNLIGLFDQLAYDEADEFYCNPDDNLSLAYLIDAIVSPVGFAPFAHCTAYSFVNSSSDTTLTQFYPKDLFKIYPGDTRLSKLQELIAYSSCQMRINTAGGAENGWIELFDPTGSYTYNDTILSTNHTFFNKAKQNRLILPNKVIVQTPADSEIGPFTQEHSEATSFGLLPKTHFEFQRVTSDALSLAIATAMMHKIENGYATGHGIAPMNCGQEVWDYITIVDSREGDSATGYVSYQTRHYEPGQFSIEFGFGNRLAGQQAIAEVLAAQRKPLALPPSPLPRLSRPWAPTRKGIVVGNW